MEQVMRMPRPEVNYTEALRRANIFIQNLWRWLLGGAKGLATAMFVQSAADRQIEESRERARQLMMRTF